MLVVESLACSSGTPMKSLGQRKLKMFCKTLRALYSPVTTTASFPVHAAAALGAVIANCIVAIDDVDTERRHKRYGTAQMAKAKSDCLVETTPIDDPVCSSRSVSRNTASRFRANIGTDHRFSIIIPASRGATRVSIYRHGSFSSRQLEMLELLSPHIVQARANAERLTAAEADHHINTPMHASEHAHFTPREMEVFHWVAEGKRNREIGVILHTSERTIQKQVQSILSKVGVETRSGATAWWFEHGGRVS